MELNRRANIDKLHEWLNTKHLESEEEHISPTVRYRKISWLETSQKYWGKKLPKVEMVYDAANGFILKVFMVIDRNNGHWRQDLLEAHFLKLLESKGILEDKGVPIGPPQDTEFKKPHRSKTFSQEEMENKAEKT
jgi:hypothetical protein